MDNRFEELSTLDLKKVDIGLRETELMEGYSQLKFNGGFVLETLQSSDSEIFKGYMKTICPSSPSNCDMDGCTGLVTNDVKDFVYHLLCNQSLADLGIYLGNGEEFLVIDSPYDSLEGFRKLAFTELTRKKLEEMLLRNAICCSIYDDWKFSSESTLKMIRDFIDRLFPEGNHFKILYFEQWGNFMIGLFEGFIFMNIDRGQFTFFAIDDYD